ncbi:MAG: type II secretion system GspH family protein [Clostridia bacterium]|nr:type II secretion system GspH family protein [Clostridia bacterium]
MKNQKGFTLMELLMVIAILAVLASVAVPNFIFHRQRSIINTDASSALEIIRAARISYNELTRSPLPNDSGSPVSTITNNLGIDVTGMVARSCNGDSANNFIVSYLPDKNHFKVTWIADENKVGAYYGDYYVEETIEFSGPIRRK